MKRATLTVIGCLLIAAPSLHGCAPTHLRPNAPGNIDVRTPPKAIAERSVEQPDDPGEHRLALTFGALAGGGFTLLERSDDGAGAALSLELSLHYGQSRGSHGEDAPFLIPVYPLPAFGFNLGYAAIAPTGDVDLGVLRPFYLELQYNDFYWIAAGWQVDFEQGRHGPQLTTGLGPLYVRCVHLFDTETQFEIGLVLKGFHVWTWSR